MGYPFLPASDPTVGILEVPDIRRSGHIVQDMTWVCFFFTFEK